MWSYMKAFGNKLDEPVKVFPKPRILIPWALALLNVLASSANQQAITSVGSVRKAMPGL